MTTALVPVLAVSHGRATCLSTDLARDFGKRHDHVLRDIRQLLADLPPERAPNFGPTSVPVHMPNGAVRLDPAYLITRDGFTLLAMGFTGKKALAFKLAYIDAFNAMEAALLADREPAQRPRLPYMAEPWFLILFQQSLVMQRCALARALDVSAPMVSQVLNGTGKYGSLQASTCHIAQRVMRVFRCDLAADSISQPQRKSLV